MKALLIVSVLCLVAGVELIFAFSSGGTSFSLAHPITSSALHVDITTEGLPAFAGVTLSALGALLLAMAWLIAVFKRTRPKVAVETPKRRDAPFAE
jgi:uncharacterized membrane protein